MGIFSNIFKQNETSNLSYDEALAKMTDWLRFCQALEEKKSYIELENYADKIDEMFSFYEDAVKLNKRLTLSQSASVIKFKKKFIDFAKRVNTFESNIEHNNLIYIKDKIPEVRKTIGQIEGYDLDDQQIACIIKSSHNHNVIAGAGTGKTTTIVGKVKYMLTTGRYKPEDILIVSFTKAASDEMRNRIKAATNEKVEVSTFHRLGYNILTEVENKKPEIYSDATKNIKEWFEYFYKNKKYKRLFYSYAISSGMLNRTDLDENISSKEEYDQYLKENAPVTLKGENVKSYGEAKIANELALNDIKYEYERKYEIDTATKEYAQYHPDFYLPDYKIYIEYFGIDQFGNVPDWFDGDDPSKTYQEGIEWKRKCHEENKTELVECYAYEDLDGQLEDLLIEKLKEKGVEVNEDFEYEFQKKGDIEKIKSSFLKTASTIISLARNNEITASQIKELGNRNKQISKLVKLVYPIYLKYEEKLKASSMIDFSDMLIKASRYINEEKYKNKYRCVIIDECQDITATQYGLIKSLHDSKDFELFCVGDDWQSIYRFNGSDVGYIMDFKKYWGDSTISRIETTYRFPQSIIDVSGNFVMKNPRQIKKSLHSKLQDDSFGVSKIEGYKEKSAISFMVDRILCLPENSSVFLLGRYGYDYKMLVTDTRLSINYSTASEKQEVKVQGRPDLKVEFLTVHKSKGLQADYVYIINNKDDIMGFPSKLEDNQLITMLSQTKEKYPFAEERRLFYVALTRAKKHAYLVTVKDKESHFVKELENDFKIVNETYICPMCKGKLTLKDGKYGKFLGCENFSTNGCKFISKIN